MNKFQRIRQWSPPLIGLLAALVATAHASAGTYVQKRSVFDEDRAPASAAANKSDAGNAPMDKTKRCIFVSNIYEAAAMMRDRGNNPERALEYVTASFEGVPVQEKKRIINQVYFDPAFERAGGRPLANQMMDVCMHGVRNYKPLE